MRDRNTGGRGHEVARPDTTGANMPRRKGFLPALKDGASAPDAR
jgi:hypothetical protein